MMRRARLVLLAAKESYRWNTRPFRRCSARCRRRSGACDLARPPWAENRCRRQKHGTMLPRPEGIPRSQASNRRHPERSGFHELPHRLPCLAGVFGDHDAFAGRKTVGLDHDRILRLSRTRYASAAVAHSEKSAVGIPLALKNCFA